MRTATTIRRLAALYREFCAFALLAHGDPPARLALYRSRFQKRQENTGNKNVLRSVWKIGLPACELNLCGLMAVLPSAKTKWALGEIESSKVFPHTAVLPSDGWRLYDSAKKGTLETESIKPVRTSI